MTISDSNNVLTFTVRGKPIPYARRTYGQGKGTRSVLNDSSVEFQARCAAAARKAVTEQFYVRPPKDAPLKITVQMFFKYPSDTRVAQRVLIAGSFKVDGGTDTSNVLKNIEDGISHTGGPAGVGAIAMLNDEQIVETHILPKRWCYPGEERVEVTVETLVDDQPRLI